MGASAPARSYASGLAVTHSLLFLHFQCREDVPLWGAGESDTLAPVDTLRSCWWTTVNVDCPNCGQVHKISARETYVGMALRGSEAPCNRLPSSKPVVAVPMRSPIPPRGRQTTWSPSDMSVSTAARAPTR